MNMPAFKTEPAMPLLPAATAEVLRFDAPKPSFLKSRVVPALGRIAANVLPPLITLGLILSLIYVAFGVWQATVHPYLGLLLLAMGVYGGGALLYYRKQILEV